MIGKLFKHMAFKKIKKNPPIDFQLIIVGSQSSNFDQTREFSRSMSEEP